MTTSNPKSTPTPTPTTAAATSNPTRPTATSASHSPSSSTLSHQPDQPGQFGQPKTKASPPTVTDAAPLHQNEFGGFQLQVLQRTQSVLDAIARQPEGLTALQFQTELNINETSMRRILHDLCKMHLIRKRKQGSYVFGTLWAKRGAKVSKSLDIKEVSTQYLQQFANACGFEISLVTQKSDKVIYQISFASDNYPKDQLHPKRYSAPLHTTAAGKVILSQWSRKDILGYCAQTELPKQTKFSIDKIEKLHKHCKKAQLKGYAYEHQENQLEHSSIATGIFDANQILVATLVINAPTKSIREDDVRRRLGKQLMEQAQLIALAMGWESS